jgi:YD repeat-containing protein
MRTLSSKFLLLVVSTLLLSCQKNSNDILSGTPPLPCGLLTESVLELTVKSLGKLSNSTFRYEYNANNQLVAEYESNGIVTTKKTEYKYNAQNKVTQKTETLIQANSSITTTYEYNADGLLVKEKLGTDEFLNGYTAIYEYDNTKKLVKTTKDFTHPWLNNQITTYEYNTQGNQTKENRYDELENQSLQLFAFTIYEFQEAKKVKSSHFAHFPQTNTDSLGQATFYEYEGNKVIKSQTFDRKNRLEESNFYEYRQNKLTKSISETAYGDNKTIQTFRYSCQ